MTEDLCELRIIGTITKDVKLNTSQSGTHWLSLSVQSTINGYHTTNGLMAFKDIADKLAETAHEGDRIKILANCRLSKNKTTNQWSTQLSIYKFELIHEKSDNSKEVKPEAKPQVAEVPSANVDELPF